jgi:hypothetical protein
MSVETPSALNLANFLPDQVSLFACDGSAVIQPLLKAMVQLRLSPH